MPTYRYRCAKCGDELDERQSFSDPPLTTHEECGGTLARVFSTPGIVLKGSGFYRTDSRNGSSRSSGRSEKPKSGEQSAPGSESGNKETGSDGAKSTTDTKDAAPSGSKTSS